MLKCGNVPSCLVCILFAVFFSLFTIFNPFSMHSQITPSQCIALSSVISDSLLPNQYLRPPIFHEEGLFFLSIAKLQKYPLIHFPFSFCILFSPIPSLQMLIQIPHVRALPNLRCYSSLYPAVTLK